MKRPQIQISAFAAAIMVSILCADCMRAADVKISLHGLLAAKVESNGYLMLYLVDADYDLANLGTYGLPAGITATTPNLAGRFPNHKAGMKLVKGTLKDSNSINYPQGSTLYPPPDKSVPWDLVFESGTQGMPTLSEFKWIFDVKNLAKSCNVSAAELAGHFSPAAELAQGTTYGPVIASIKVDRAGATVTAKQTLCADSKPAKYKIASPINQTIVCTTEIGLADELVVDWPGADVPLKVKVGAGVSWTITPVDGQIELHIYNSYGVDTHAEPFRWLYYFTKQSPFGHVYPYGGCSALGNRCPFLLLSE